MHKLIYYYLESLKSNKASLIKIRRFLLRATPKHNKITFPIHNVISITIQNKVQKLSFSYMIAYCDNKSSETVTLNRKKYSNSKILARE